MQELSAERIEAVNEATGSLARLAEGACYGLEGWLQAQSSELEAARDIVADAKAAQLLADLTALCGPDGEVVDGCRVADTSGFLARIGRRLGGSEAVDVIKEASEAYELVLCHYDQIRGTFGWGGWSPQRSASSVFSPRGAIDLTPEASEAVIGVASELLALAEDARDGLRDFVGELAAQMDPVIEAIWSDGAGSHLNVLSAIFGTAGPSVAPAELECAADWLWGVWGMVPPRAKFGAASAGEAVDMLSFRRYRVRKACDELMEM